MSAPRHVALIIDGNGRWGERRSLPRAKGHQVGARNVLPILRAASDAGVEAVTTYLFSTENWQRPESEVRSMLSVVLQEIEEGTQEAHEYGIRMRFIGSRDGLSSQLLAAMHKAEIATESNDGIDCYFAVNYGGQAEIVEAARRIISDGLQPEEVNVAKFSEYLHAPEAAPVDLLIRTSGEQRVSNFLLWQMAYAEFYFTETLWPDFSVDEFSHALSSYEQRARRWGRLPEVEDDPKQSLDPNGAR